MGFFEIIVLVLLLFLPVYFVIVIKRERNAYKEYGVKFGPSIFTLVLYIFVLFSSCLPLMSISVKSGQAEARQILTAIYNVQQSYFEENETYAGGEEMRVSVVSARKSVARTRWSMKLSTRSSNGRIAKNPGPFSARNFPRRSTTPFSHCFATCSDVEISNPR